jgi:hypothetical protein
MKLEYVICTETNRSMPSLDTCPDLIKSWKKIENIYVKIKLEDSYMCVHYCKNRDIEKLHLYTVGP